MSGAARIIAVGDIVTDVLAVLSGPLATGSDTPADIQLTGGGQAANTAAWLASRRHPVTLVAVVGDDEPGRARVAELTAVGVDCAVRHCAEAPTGTVIVLAGQGDRTMVSERGANVWLAPADVDSALTHAPDARHLHLSAYTLLDPRSRGAGRHALAAARERGLTTSVDAASAEPLRRLGAALFLDWVREVDLLLANADEALVLAGTGNALAQAARLTGAVRHAVVKRGGAGAVWATRDGTTAEAPAHRVPVRDVTGAGDAFAAGLLSAWVRGADPATALTLGGELGAVAVSTVGARPPA
ncbi:carbohydrate kinase family protein [Micromonospora sp. NPDC050397]|uniref:carbohydrate kinase family protein n=1 Tax=Micromonospora sp. NPDC050397 TaxID=3364279 RepID=UPI00384DD41B